MLRKAIFVLVLASSMLVSGAGRPKTVNVPHKPSPKILGVVLLRHAALASFASLAQCAGGWGTICNCQVGCLGTRRQDVACEPFGHPPTCVCQNCYIT